MNIPNQVKIGGILYSVGKTEEDIYIEGNQVMGLINSELQEILLDTKAKTDFVNITFLHEIIHGILMDRCIILHDNPSIEENWIQNLASGLYQVLKDNDLLKDKQLKEVI